MEPSLLQFFQKGQNLLLLVTALASGGMLLWPLVRRSAGGPSVDVAGATQLINREDALVVDVREPGEYDSGHIIGARNIPLARIEADELKRKDKPVILYCETGNRASQAATALRKRGFEKVVLLNGGIGAWKQAGLPVEK